MTTNYVPLSESDFLAQFKERALRGEPIIRTEYWISTPDDASNRHYAFIIEGPDSDYFRVNTTYYNETPYAVYRPEVTVVKPSLFRRLFGMGA